MAKAKFRLRECRAQASHRPAQTVKIHWAKALLIAVDQMIPGIARYFTRFAYST